MLRLVDYLSTNKLLNSFQSAYIKHHSTKITLLSAHDYIVTQRYESSPGMSHHPHLILLSVFTHLVSYRVSVRFISFCFYMEQNANINIAQDLLRELIDN